MNTTNMIRGLVGAVVGAVLGYAAFFFLARQGFYAMVLPGAFVGLGCGYLSGVKSVTLGIVSAVLAFSVSVYAEWKFAPFDIDNSFMFFLLHLHALNTVKLIMIAAGTLFGFWFGKGRDRFQNYPREATHRDTE